MLLSGELVITAIFTSNIFAMTENLKNIFCHLNIFPLIRIHHEDFFILTQTHEPVLLTIFLETPKYLRSFSKKCLHHQILCTESFPCFSKKQYRNETISYNNAFLHRLLFRMQYKRNTA